MFYSIMANSLNGHATSASVYPSLRTSQKEMKEGEEVGGQQLCLSYQLWACIPLGQRQGRGRKPETRGLH